jgi:hypothetical protein
MERAIERFRASIHDWYFSGILFFFAMLQLLPRSRPMSPNSIGLPDSVFLGGDQAPFELTGDLP